MQIFDPRTGNQVNIIDLAAERLKRASDPFKNDPPPQRDYGDETDTTLKSYNDGTRDKV